MVASVWVDRSGRFAVDALLRSHGFSIVKRSVLGNRWRRGLREYEETDALAQISQDEVWDAEYQDMLYWEGYDLVYANL